MAPERLRVLVLSDTKPGHLTVSLGVVKALGLVTAVEHRVVETRLRIKFVRRLLRFLLNRHADRPWLRGRLGRWLFHAAYRIADDRALSGGRYDLLLSAGGDTAYVNVWLSRVLDVPNIYISALRGLSPGLFTLFLSREDRQRYANEINFDLAPTAITRTEMLAAGESLRGDLDSSGAPLWSVLIGGEGAGYHFTDQEMQRMARDLSELAKRHGAMLLVTTSRRTGEKADEVLAAGFASGGRLLRGVFYSQGPEKVVAKFLGAASVVFCTAESGSMLTEAMTLGRPLYALVPARLELRGNEGYEQFLAFHEGRGRLRRVPLASLAQLDIGAGVQRDIPASGEDPHAWLAARLAARLWGEDGVPGKDVPG